MVLLLPWGKVRLVQRGRLEWEPRPRCSSLARTARRPCLVQLQIVRANPVSSTCRPGCNWYCECPDHSYGSQNTSILVCRPPPSTRCNTPGQPYSAQASPGMPCCQSRPPRPRELPALSGQMVSLIVSLSGGLDSLHTHASDLAAGDLRQHSCPPPS